jgi:hypothetical protein
MYFNPARFHEQPRHRRPFRFFRGLFVALGAAVLLLAVVAAPLAYAGVRMINEAKAGQADLMAAQAAAEGLDFAAAGPALTRARDHFRRAAQSSLILAPLEAVPYWGEQVRGARSLVTSSLDATEALLKVSGIGEKLLGTLSHASGFDAGSPSLGSGVVAFFRLSAEDRRTILEALGSAPDELEAAIGEIDSALVGFASLPTSPYFAPVTAALEPAAAKLKALRGRLIATLVTAKLIPDVSGYPVPKKFLVLFQNNTELRPTGGFIGTIGSVTIANAAAEDLETMDVYALDGKNEGILKTVAPAPLKRYLAATKWFLRDANWSPDFPTSAQKILDLYRLEGGAEDYDGVVAVDTTVAAGLLRIVGDVKIGSSVFTPDNVADEIEFQVEKGFAKNGLPIAQRKDILVQLIDEVFARVMSLPLSDWQRAVDFLTGSLAEKHVLLFSFDPNVFAFAEERNWNGALRQAQGDALMVVDANLAAYKTDSVMSRSIRYSIAPEGDGYRAKVTLRYTNRGAFTWKTTRYRTYTRVYVPAGSVLLGGTGMMANDKILDPKRTPGTVDVGDELGRRYFGAFLSVEPGETREMSFEYRLPAAVAAQIKAGRYSLLVQKQAGTDAVPLTLDLDFGKTLRRATPGEETKQWGDARYVLSTDLRTDRDFEVGF